MTPGTHPQNVSMNTIRKEPHPLSKTAKGGKKMERSTRQTLMLLNKVIDFKTLVQNLSKSLQCT